MWLDGAELLVCPKHGDGRDAVTLSTLNAEHAARRHDQISHDITGPYYDKTGDLNVAHRTTRSDIDS